jgi:Fe-S cluster assembly protein SufD
MIEAAVNQMEEIKSVHEAFMAESGRFVSLRNIGWSQFEKSGFPGRQDEEYKFTALNQLLKRAFDWSNVTMADSLSREFVQSHFYAIDGHHVVFVNGFFRDDLSSLGEDKTKFTAFDEMTDAEVSGAIGKIADMRAVVALNQAFLTNGLVIQVPKSHTSLPVFVYHFHDSSEGVSLSFPRMLARVGENAEIRFYEKSFNTGVNAHFGSQVIEIDVAQHARVRFTKIQQQAPHAYMIDNLFVKQARESHSFINTFSLSGGLIRNNLEIMVDGEHCESNMYGLYLLDGKTHVDNHTVVDHRYPNTVSNELYKGVVDGNATGVFNGKIFVRQAAQKTNAFQANNNVLLSENATVHTKPQLEIWADDVKCSHGCTSGQLDEEALFYLQTRGIARTTAKAMLLNSFAEETLKHVLLEQVNEEISNLIHQRLDV